MEKRPICRNIAKVDENAAGKMKHVEVNGKEIVIANMNGKFCALDNRCAHMNAPTVNGKSYWRCCNMSFSWSQIQCRFWEENSRTSFDTLTRNGTATKNVAKSHGTYRSADVPY